MSEQSGSCEVWECRPADTYYAMHNVLLIEETGAGGSSILLDAELPDPDRRVWAGRSAVEALLALTGFSGSFHGLMRVTERQPSEMPVVKIRGFVADRGDRGKIESAARRAMTGDTGGLWPLVLDATGFNACPLAFDAAWEAAGKPPVLLPHPALDLPEGKAAPIDVATSGISFVRTEYKRHALRLPDVKER